MCSLLTILHRFTNTHSYTQEGVQAYQIMSYNIFLLEHPKRCFPFICPFQISTLCFLLSSIKTLNDAGTDVVTAQHLWNRFTLFFPSQYLLTFFFFSTFCRAHLIGVQNLWTIQFAQQTSQWGNTTQAGDPKGPVGWQPGQTYLGASVQLPLQNTTSSPTEACYHRLGIREGSRSC